MDYLKIDNYRYKWFFQHRDMPVPVEELELIRPLSEKRSNQLWLQLISKHSNHPEFFTKDEWPSMQNTWQQEGNWQSGWDSDSDELPAEISDFIYWEMNTVVYFGYHSDNILETTWEVFVNHWKNFLFLDNGPILFAKRRKEVIQFYEDGTFKVGFKPAL